MRVLSLFIALLAAQACVLIGGVSGPSPAGDGPKRPPVQSVTFCVTTLDSYRDGAALRSALVEGAREAGLLLAPEPACGAKTALRAYVSSANDDKSAATFVMSVISAVSLGFLPLSTRSETSILFQWKPEAGPLVARRYRANVRFVGSYWAYLIWWRSAYPERLAVPLARRSAALFARDMVGDGTPYYRHIRLKDGRTFQFVRMKDGPQGAILSDIDGNQFRLAPDSVADKQLLDRPIAL